MGAVKKVFKGIGGIFGIGGGNDSMNTSVNTAPIATPVTNTDVSMQNDLISNAKKKKKDFASQNTASDLVGSANSSNGNGENRPGIG